MPQRDCEKTGNGNINDGTHRDDDAGVRVMRYVPPAYMGDADFMLSLIKKHYEEGGQWRTYIEFLDTCLGEEDKLYSNKDFVKKLINCMDDERDLHLLDRIDAELLDDRAFVKEIVGPIQSNSVQDHSFNFSKLERLCNRLDLEPNQLLALLSEVAVGQGGEGTHSPLIEFAGLGIRRLTHKTPLHHANRTDNPITLSDDEKDARGNAGNAFTTKIQAHVRIHKTMKHCACSHTDDPITLSSDEEEEEGGGEGEGGAMANSDEAASKNAERGVDEEVVDDPGADDPAAAMTTEEAKKSSTENPPATTSKEVVVKPEPMDTVADPSIDKTYHEIAQVVSLFSVPCAKHHSSLPIPPHLLPLPLRITLHAT